MASILVTTNADSGAGSLRQAIADAVNGDTITFDTSAFNLDIEYKIELSSPITITQATAIIINGLLLENGNNKIVIDGQETYRLFTVNSNRKAIFNNITFSNAYNASGGCFNETTGSKITLNNCVCNNCKATIGGVAFLAGTAEFISNNCIYNNCLGTTSSCIVYLSASAKLTLNNSMETGTHTTSSISATNYTASSIIIQGNNSFVNVSLESGVPVTFSGVDSVLAVTTSATIASATFTAAADSTGYAAFPSGTDTSAATFTGVSVATYSATAATVSATVVEREATITTNADVATSVVEAIFDDSTLSPLSVSAGKAAISKDRTFKVRLFNGSFYESSWVPRTYYYQGGTTGSFATASDWAMDSGKTLTCNAAPTIANSTFDCR